MQQFATLVGELRSREVRNPVELAFFRVLGAFLRTRPPKWEGFQIPEKLLEEPITHKAVRMRSNDSCVVYTCSRRDPSPSEDRLDVETMHGLTFHGRPSTRRPAITMHVVRRRATKPGGPVIEFTHVGCGQRLSLSSQRRHKVGSGSPLVARSCADPR